MNKLIPLTLAALTAAGIVSVAPTASASGGGREVIREGSCSAASDWKVKAKDQDGAIEVEGEVDSNVVGQRWTWRIVDNGTLQFKGSALTTGPSGSFSVNRILANQAGADHIVFKSRNPATGETCVGKVTF